MIFLASLLTGTKHPAFSTNYLADTDKCDTYNQKQH